MKRAYGACSLDISGRFFQADTGGTLVLRALRPEGPRSLDILRRPKGENRIAHGLQPWEDVPERNRPERAAECRSLFPKITFGESDSMAFQKLTKLFLIRKFAVMFGLIGNVGGDSLYVV